MTEEEKQIADFTKILKEHDMKISLFGCGCCGSPRVVFEYKGDVIVDDDNFNIDTFEEDR